MALNNIKKLNPELNNKIIIILAFFLITLPFQACAKTKNFRSKIRESSKCSSILPYYAHKNKVPKYIAKAIMLKESGRYSARLRRNISWPWAANVAGKSHYFESKKQAMIFVKNNLRKGKRNIDVGCMQINLHYHGKNFKSLSHAFDPAHNINYGTRLLRSKYNKLKKWSKATEHYHSGGTKQGRQYSREIASLAHDIKKRSRYSPKRKIRRKKNISRITRSNAMIKNRNKKS